MTLFRDRDYFYCEYCGSFHFPLPSPGGIRLLGENPDEIRCPHCQIPLHIVTLDDRFQGYHCQNCRGFLFEMTAFRDAVGTRRALAETPPETPRPLNRSELERTIDCPSCSQVMSTHPYLGPGAIVIDTCSQCSLIWLDPGELSQVVNAPGKDRGKGLPPPKLEFSHSSSSENKANPVKSHWERDLVSLLGKIFNIDD